MARFRLSVNDTDLRGNPLAHQPDTLKHLMQAGNEYLLVTKDYLSHSLSRVPEVGDEVEGEQVRAATRLEVQTVAKENEALTKEL